MDSARETVLVAMSGGVDSSVAAALLAASGHRVIGVFMSNGIKAVSNNAAKAVSSNGINAVSSNAIKAVSSNAIKAVSSNAIEAVASGAAPAGGGRTHRQGCCSEDDARDARRVADQLGIPFYAVDLEDAFDALVDDFARAYAEGRTPNPCIECNRRFKMGALLELAGRLGAAAVATGHYARIVAVGGRLAVARGADRAKDQSYVLYPLTQDQLAKTRLPLGDLTKDAVRAAARRFGLKTAEKPESMEICFVPSGDYRDVVRERRPDALRPGPIVDGAGRVLGTHGGAALFTVGQRRGLPAGQPAPIYVNAIDAATGTVRVGPRAALAAAGCVVEDPVYGALPPAGPGFQLEGDAVVRAHHEGVPARATVLGDGRLALRFAAPVLAVAPGQAAVLYDAEGRILIGGTIGAERWEV